MFQNVILRSGWVICDGVARRENPAGPVGTREFLVTVRITATGSYPIHGYGGQHDN